MALFKRRRTPIEPLNIDPIAAAAATSAQDNVPGAQALDFEALEHQEAMQEAARGTRIGPLLGGQAVRMGPFEGDLVAGAALQRSRLDPNSLTPGLIPSRDEEDD